MSKFPIFQDRFRLNNFKKGELPLFICEYTLRDDYPTHHHEFAEIALVIEGEGTETVDGKEYRLAPGTVGLLLPYHLHSLRLEPGKGLRKFCCMFDIDLLFHLEHTDFGRWFTMLADRLPPFYKLNPQTFPTVRAVLDTLLAEYGSANPGKQSFMLIKLLEFLHLYFRHHPDYAAADNVVEAKAGEWDYIKYVHNHYMDERISLEEVAKRFGVSVYAVRNGFKRLIGKNFLEYVHWLRIRRASALLATTDMTVSEIAYDVGFYSLRTFTRVFKETTGMSATEFRRKHARSSQAE
jgi:AraC-like DNA-binding protein